MSTIKAINLLSQHLCQQIVGQENLVRRMLIVLLADGHLLLEGAPGLAKTRAIKSLSKGLETTFHRIQFTPDLLPADVTGSDIYIPESASFKFQQGPIFHNLVLADEINRAPAKVQSALLEAMGERQISIGSHTYPLPEIFMVMATQNPIEQEGTYPLPEAQLDRFLMHIRVSYPDIESERKILNIARGEAMKSKSDFDEPLTQEIILDARQQILNIHMEPSVEEYIIQLVNATRHPELYNKELSTWLEYGVSPRGTIALDRCSKAHAWLHGKDFVSPDDVQAVIHDVFRHRILLSFEAEASEKDKDQIIHQILQIVPVS